MCRKRTFVPKRRLHYQRSPRDESQIWLSPQDKTRRSNRWMVALQLLAAIIGGVMGYFSLPSRVSDVVGPGYFLSAAGVWFCAVLGGSGVCFLLACLLGIVITDEGIRKSRRALFWCSAGIFALAIIGAVLGYIYLSGLLPASLRVFFGAIIGLAVLIGLIRDPKAVLKVFLRAVLSELIVTGCLEGCFSLFFVFFIVPIGVVSGLLIWHTLFL